MADKLIQVVAEGDSLFGKAFKFIEQIGEHILVDIKTDVGVIQRVFHKDHVQEISNNVPTVTTAAAVNASGVAKETAPAPAPTPAATPAGLPENTATPSTPPVGTTPPVENAGQ